MKDYGKPFRVVAAVLGLTIEELADRLQEPAPLLEGYESGHREPSMRVLMKLSAAAGCEAELFHILIEGDLSGLNGAERRAFGLDLLRFVVEEQSECYATEVEG